MAKSYKLLTENIKGRINPENYELKKSFSDELANISYSDVLTYIRIAMKGVETEYTQKSKEAGNRVKGYLSQVLKDVEFQYQGSVMTDTHIKGNSDIDLLIICDKFYLYDAYQVKYVLESADLIAKCSPTTISRLQKEINTSSYQGSVLQDLLQIRSESENVLKNVYDKCDLTKPKSIKIVNQNLNREVDVVVANWYDNLKSVINGKNEYRGIQIYNKLTHSQEVADYPFLSIKNINERSSVTNGRLKKMIRFLKNVKADSNQDIDLSSFDINAICYDVDVAKYQNLTFYQLVAVISSQIEMICNDQSKADSILSVDGNESIFVNKSQKINSLRLLMTDVKTIQTDLEAETL